MGLFWIVFWASAVVGPVLLVIGLRGKRFGTEPHCRKCNYNMSGFEIPRLCPECGSLVSKPNRVRIGSREPKPTLKRIGIACLAFVAAASFYQLASHGVARDRLPTSVLLFQIKHSIFEGATIEGRNKIFDELLTRENNAALSNKQFLGLVPLLLQHQGETLPYQWHDRAPPKLTGRALDRGLFTASEKELLLAQSFPPLWTYWSERVLAGSELWFGSVRSNSMEPPDGYHIFWTTELVDADLNGKLLPLVSVESVKRDGRPIPYHDISVARGRGSSGHGVDYPFGNAIPTDPLPIGKHQITGTFRLKVWMFQESSSPDFHNLHSHQLGKPHAVKTQTLDYTIEVVDDPLSHVSYARDEDKRPNLQQARLQVSAVLKHPRSQQPSIALLFEIDYREENQDDLPVMGHLSLRAGGSTAPLFSTESRNLTQPRQKRSAALLTGQETHWSNISGDYFTSYPFEVLHRRAVLIIEPDAGVAVHDHTVDKIWGETIELPVTIDWSAVPEEHRPPLPPETPSPNP